MSDQPTRGNGVGVARDVVGAFRGQPALLFLMLMNVLMLGGVGYLAIWIGTARQAEMAMIMERQDKYYTSLFEHCFKDQESK
jgi:hypothetical protein